MYKYENAGLHSCCSLLHIEEDLEQLLGVVPIYSASDSPTDVRGGHREYIATYGTNLVKRKSRQVIR